MYTMRDRLDLMGNDLDLVRYHQLVIKEREKEEEEGKDSRSLKEACKNWPLEQERNPLGWL